MKNNISTEASCADAIDPDSISLAEALRRIEQQVRPVHACERLPIRDCLGRINNEVLKSPRNVPPLANSAVDGFAFAFDSLRPDFISELKVAGSAFAGQPFTDICRPGQCVRIMTGALIPEGTDTVVMQEQVKVVDDKIIRIGAGHELGQNIRAPGEDIKQGETVLEARARLSPADLGVLASLGIRQLQVKRKPLVAFLSTGDELVPLGAPLEPGKIHDSNRYSLYGLLSRLEVDILDLGVVPDDPEQLSAALSSAAAQADLIISTGGVSVGDADYVKPVLEELGSTEFWKIAIKPGRPLTFGQIGASIFMGLPGNPVAVMVTFSQFVMPAIEMLAGAPRWRPALFRARAVNRLRKKPGRYEFQRGIATRDENDQWIVAATGRQGSGIMTSMSRANCFIVLPDIVTGVDPGDEVDIQFFDWSL